MCEGPAGQRRSRSLTPDEAKFVTVVLKAIAAPSRLVILSRLRNGSATVGELVNAVGTTQPAVSHQLARLRNLGLVVWERRGHCIVYSLNGGDVATLLDEAVYLAERLCPATRQDSGSRT